MGLDVKVYGNGSFDIKMGRLTVENCFPGLDQQSLRTVNCVVVENENSYEITYHTLEGLVTVNILESEGEIFLKSRLSAFRKMPYLFSPIYRAGIENLDGIFKQGFGIGGPSGYSRLKPCEAGNENILSYGLVSLACMEEFLFLAAADHKHFINRYEVSFSESDQIFWGQEAKRYSQLSVSFQTENLNAHEIELPVIKIFSRDNLHNGLILRTTPCDVGIYRTI